MSSSELREKETRSGRRKEITVSRGAWHPLYGVAAEGGKDRKKLRHSGKVSFPIFNLVLHIDESILIRIYHTHRQKLTFSIIKLAKCKPPERIIFVIVLSHSVESYSPVSIGSIGNLHQVMGGRSDEEIFKLSILFLLQMFIFNIHGPVAREVDTCSYLLNSDFFKRRKNGLKTYRAMYIKFIIIDNNLKFKMMKFNLGHAKG